MPGPRSFDQKQQFDFENLILRDLLVFAEAQGARVMHYRDDTGLEADAVYQLADGRYALIEIKTGMNAVAAAERIVFCHPHRSNPSAIW